MNFSFLLFLCKFVGIKRFLHFAVNMFVFEFLSLFVYFRMFEFKNGDRQKKQTNLTQYLAFVFSQL